jgi:hypothetical protein
MRFSRRDLVMAGGLSAIATASRIAPAAATDALTPEMFGARGDGVTNDSAAFAALAAAIKRRGGGTIQLRRTVYIVGGQRQDPTGQGGFAFAPSKLLEFTGLPGALTIEGNGATMRCQAGLRYGTFDPVSAQPTKHAMPFFKPNERATPYWAMILVDGCGGPVTISDLELDGNLPNLEIGGGYGDTGYQIGASGIILSNNKHDEILVRIHSHHHAQDGLIISGLDDPASAQRVKRQASEVKCDYNGRQGCSFVGGRSWTFTRCSFNHTGKSKVSGAPGAGVDIEAEGGKTNRNLTFNDCEFIDNWGCGMVADSGDSADATFNRCRFIGTTAWSAWPNKPGFVFRSCSFVGSIVRCHGDPDPRRATQFYDCTFTDDPKLSPTGQVYLARPAGPIADLSNSANVLFSGCRFLAVAGGTLPWSIGAIYADCTMRQTSGAGYPRGTYVGHNVIDGKVDLYSSRFPGKLILNGKPYPP